MSRIDEIEKRVNEATPGEWRLFDKGYDDQFPTTVDFNRMMADHNNVITKVVWARLGVPDKMCMEKRDAEFISHARSDVEWLIARVRELETALLFYASPVSWGNAAGFQGTIADLDLSEVTFNGEKVWKGGRMARAALKESDET